MGYQAPVRGKGVGSGLGSGLGLGLGLGPQACPKPTLTLSLTRCGGWGAGEEGGRFLQVQPVVPRRAELQ